MTPFEGSREELEDCQIKSGIHRQ